MNTCLIRLYSMQVRKAMRMWADCFRIDPDGYYYYNCQENYAVFDENAGMFKLYEAPGIYR